MIFTFILFFLFNYLYIKRIKEIKKTIIKEILLKNQKYYFKILYNFKNVNHLYYSRILS